MLNQKLIDREFGYIGDHVYLNHSLVGMPPERVKDACRTFMDDYVATYNDSIKTDLLAKRKKAKKNIADFCLENNKTAARLAATLFLALDVCENMVFSQGQTFLPNKRSLI